MRGRTENERGKGNVWRRWMMLSFLLFVFAGRTGIAADVSSGFDAANKLYEEGKFSEAASAYGKLIQAGTVSSALYFNLGNAYFKSGQLGRAVAAYRDAERIAPRDPEVRANLQFVRGQVQGPTLSRTALQRWLASLTINEWAILTVVIFWVWLSLLVAIQFRRDWKEPLRGLLLASGLATLAAFICLWAAWTSSSAPGAIVVAHDVVIHNGPLDEAPGGITIHDGAEANVVDTKNDWLQIHLDGNREGWVKRDQVVLTPGA